MSKITMAAAAAVGYVLGSRAGRERYDQIAEKAQTVWNNPKVQQGTRRAKQKAEDVADEKGLSSDDTSSDFSADGGQDKGTFNV
ncbi:MAG: YtxH domain-containing protein [Ornithinimicrobium sp.]